MRMLLFKIINVSSSILWTRGGFMNTIGKGKVHAFLWIFVSLALLCLSAPQNNAAATEFPIATTTDHEFGVSAAFDGTNYLVGIESATGDCSSCPDCPFCQSKVTAQLISATGAPVGSRIDTGRTGGVPHIAFDGTNYLMVWEDDASNDHIYGQLVSKSGQLLGSPFQISQATGWQQNHGFHPVLFDGTNYFVVWDDAPSRNGCTDEYGQFVTTAGTLLGSPIKINTTLCGGGGATVAFDGTNILTAWGSERNVAGTRSVCWTDLSGYHCDIANIWGQFITKSSAGIPGTLSGSNFLISAASVLYNVPALAFDGTKYLAGFAQETTRPDACPSSGCKWDLYGQPVTKAGVPLGSKIPASTTAPDHQFASIVWNGTNYLVTWTEGFGTTTTTVKGLNIDASGSPVGSEFTLFSPIGDGRTPWLAVPMWNGTNYFTIVNRGTPGADPTDINAYTNQDVYGTIGSNTNPSGATISFSGTVVDGSSGQPRAIISGAKIEMVENPSLYTFSDTNGSFTLTGLPSGQDFQLKATKTGAATTYIPNYSPVFKSTVDIPPGHFSLVTDAWKQQNGNNDPNKGLLAGRLVDSANPSNGYISGAVVTAKDALGNSLPVTYYYVDANGTTHYSDTSTQGNGFFFVFNVDDGKVVTITASKSGITTLQTVTYVSHADGITASSVFGYPSSNTVWVTGSVTLPGSTTPIAGVTVEMVGDATKTTTTNDDGSFTLAGLPKLTKFDIRFTKSGYTPSYITNLNIGGNIYAIRPFWLFNSGQLATWGVASGKGAITGSVRNSINPSTMNISGATITGASPYSVTYVVDASGNLGGSTTSSHGGFLIFNVTPGETLTLTASEIGYAFTTNSATAYADGVTFGSFSGTYSLSAGWNFISFPKLPSASTAIETVLADISPNVRIVWGYDNNTKAWLKWKPSTSTSTSASTLTSIESGNGYWIYMDQPGTINMTNWTAQSTTVSLTEGWNLIGYNGTDDTGVATALNSINGKWTIIWNWDSGTWYAKHASSLNNITTQPLNSLYQGKAYWIKMKGAATWQQ